MEVCKTRGMASRRNSDLNAADTSTVVALEIAAQLGKDVEETTPLAESIDPDALDRLFSADTGDLQVSFTHESHTVCVSSSGVEVERTQRER